MKKYKNITISKRNSCLAIVIGSCIAFLSGLVSKKIYVECNWEHRQDSLANADNAPFLPCPILLAGKEAPRSKYTCMLFNCSNSNLYSMHLKKEEPDDSSDEKEVCIPVNAGPGYKTCSIDTCSTDDEYDPKNKERTDNSASNDPKANGGAKEYPPFGQHLMVDIKNVDGTFLNSSKRLAEALVDVVNETKLTLLSYHCHKMIPMGVSCVGILLQSHISVHAWPEFGVIALDLYTCGPGELVPIVSVIEKLFAIPEIPLYEGEVIERPRVIWTHKLRGFRSSYESNYLAKDLGSHILERDFDLKVKIASTETESQRIDLFDFIEANRRDILSHEQSLSNDGSYPALHPEFFRCQQSLFLNGTLRSTREGVEAFYEAFVQPGMFAHPAPKKVLIIGGGEAAILREVLKHNTVESVTMVDNNKALVKFAMDYLPCLNVCSDLIGSADWCGDDNRTVIIYKDPIAWFDDHFHDTNEMDDLLDVVVIDTLNPECGLPQNINARFIDTLYNVLTEDGVVIFQLGGAPRAEDPNFEFTDRDKWITSLFVYLEDAGFESMHVYEDGNGGLLTPWAFLVVMKDSDSRESWYRTQAQLEVDIYKRIRRTHSGVPALKYFDSTTMEDYMYPHHNFEINFCRQDPTPESCEMIREEMEIIPDIPVSDLEVRISGVSGRGVYATIDIKKGTSIGRKNSVHPVLIHSSTTDLLEKWAEHSTFARKAYTYVDGYGWQINFYGETTYLVDSSILTFVNHGCNGTFNIDPLEHDDPYNKITEHTATPSDVFKINDRDLYDPVLDRHGMKVATQTDKALRDIKAGEELLCNYVFFASNSTEWYEYIRGLRKMCRGEEVGLITKEEEAKKRSASDAALPGEDDKGGTGIKHQA